MSSVEFDRAFVVGGGPVQECDFCGRTYYSTQCTGWGGMDEEELKHYEELSAKKPDMYIGEAYDSFEVIEIDGRRFVTGCLCNSIDKYEAFIWRHRDRILRYLSDRIEHDTRAQMLEQKRIDEAIVIQENAKKVAHALRDAERKLAVAENYK